jgi:hypothetical protein
VGPGAGDDGAILPVGNGQLIAYVNGLRIMGVHGAPHSYPLLASLHPRTQGFTVQATRLGLSMEPSSKGRHRQELS